MVLVSSCAASQAIFTADVVLPTPPFTLKNAIRFMMVFASPASALYYIITALLICDDGASAAGIRLLDRVEEIEPVFFIGKPGFIIIVGNIGLTAPMLACVEMQ